MKKLLFIGLMCVMNVSAFAKESSNYRKQCTLHYSRVWIENGEQVRYVSFSLTMSTCSEALAYARAISGEMAPE